MPVTARLSKHFYEVLGEAVAQELVDWFNAVDLTYRTELRELNELNFARFDAKLEQRITELRAEFRQEMGEFKVEVRQELTEFRREIAEFKAGIHQELGKLREELADFKVEIHQELGKFRGGIAEFEGKIGEEISALRSSVYSELAALRSENERGQVRMLRWMFGFWATTMLGMAGMVMTMLRGA